MAGTKSSPANAVSRVAAAVAIVLALGAYLSCILLGVGRPYMVSLSGDDFSNTLSGSPI